ncbi:hypothetical protein VNO77_18744 [Canavalia gladiata]|uniref:Uncharacterized protein n=1 Tax=Canavalia gladiata TaxID=3824 RepID=A0AAN9LLD9_CANGL
MLDPHIRYWLFSKLWTLLPLQLFVEESNSCSSSKYGSIMVLLVNHSYAACLECEDTIINLGTLGRSKNCPVLGMPEAGTEIALTNAG